MWLMSLRRFAQSAKVVTPSRASGSWRMTGNWSGAGIAGAANVAPVFSTLYTKGIWWPCAWIVAVVASARQTVRNDFIEKLKN
jgi:hypothetical protein